MPEVTQGRGGRWASKKTTRRDGGAELQSVPKITGFNLKSLRSAYDVKAFVLLIAIRPSDMDVKPDCPLIAFRTK